MRQRSRTVDLASRMLGGDLRGARIGALGAAFKADSDDVRDSPALDVARTLAARGARVTVYDPRANENVRRCCPELATATSVEAAIRDGDLVMVLTDWAEFAALDPVSLSGLVATPRVLDGQLVLDPVKWRAAGWVFHALGRGGGH
jgi:UDPglucose 6-dehydrogenase